MIENRIICSREYYSSDIIRETARDIKSPESIKVNEAARMMASDLKKYGISDSAILVPIPSSDGTTSVNMRLAEAIAAITGNSVLDALSSEKRDPLYGIKKSGKDIRDVNLKIKLKEPLPEKIDCVLIDNIVSTGTTFRQSEKLIPGARILSYAKSSRDLKAFKKTGKLHPESLKTPFGHKNDIVNERRKGIEKSDSVLEKKLQVLAETLAFGNAKALSEGKAVAKDFLAKFNIKEPEILPKSLQSKNVATEMKRDNGWSL